MGPKMEVPVFVETSLGTRIALPVSPDITADNFKRELERAHIDCFPQLGLLTIDAVMVKRESCFYRLPGSLPLKHVCLGYRNFCILYVDASPSNKLEKTCPLGRLVSRRASSLLVNNGKEVTEKVAGPKSRKQRLKRTRCLEALVQGLVTATSPLKKKKRRKRMYGLQKFPAGFTPERLEQESLGPQGQISGACAREGSYEEEVLHQGNQQQEVWQTAQVSDSNITSETPLESFSETVSVSGIINKYFTNLIEVDHIRRASSSETVTRTKLNQLNGQCAEVGKMSLCKLSTDKLHDLHRTHQKIFPSPSPEAFKPVSMRTKYERSDVGTRLLMASNIIGLRQSKQSSQGSSLSKSKRLRNPDVDSGVRSLVFEIDDND